VNILVVTTSFPSFPGDPAGHFVESEVNALRDEGHQVWVLCPRPPLVPPSRSNFVRNFESGDLFGSPGAWPRVKQRPWRLLWLIPAAWSVWQKRKQLPRPDHVIAHWLLPAGLPFGLWLADSAAELTVVVHGTDLNLLLQLPARWIDRILAPLAARRASLRFVSGALKNQLLDRPLSAPVQEMVTRATVRPSPLQLGGQSSKDDARAQLDIPAEQRLLVIVGRLIAQKRIQVALGAASLIPEARIVVLGDGPARTSLEQQFPDATFLGTLVHDEALRWIQAADVLLSASRWEGAPTAIREALALGTLVVAPAIADLPEWAEREPALWLVQ
jgi:glycosyltransferase involved in cell wall biosynthesis